MDRESVLSDLRKAQQGWRADAPTESLYEMLRAAEDGVAVLLDEGELITYINARLSLMERFQIRPGQQRPIA